MSIGAFISVSSSTRGLGSPAVFSLATLPVDVPLAVLVPSSTEHATLSMPLPAPLADFAGVARATTVTAWIMGHRLTPMFSPTSVDLVGGLAIAHVDYNVWLKFAWPLLLALLVAAALIVGIAATLH